MTDQTSTRSIRTIPQRERDRMTQLIQRLDRFVRAEQEIDEWEHQSIVLAYQKIITDLQQNFPAAQWNFNPPVGNIRRENLLLPNHRVAAMFEIAFAAMPAIDTDDSLIQQYCDVMFRYTDIDPMVDVQILSDRTDQLKEIQRMVQSYAQLFQNSNQIPSMDVRWTLPVADWEREILIKIDAFYSRAVTVTLPNGMQPITSHLEKVAVLEGFLDAYRQACYTTLLGKDPLLNLSQPDELLQDLYSRLTGNRLNELQTHPDFYFLSQIRDESETVTGSTYTWNLKYQNEHLKEPYELNLKVTTSDTDGSLFLRITQGQWANKQIIGMSLDSNDQFMEDYGKLSMAEKLSVLLVAIRLKAQ